MNKKKKDRMMLKHKMLIFLCQKKRKLTDKMNLKEESKELKEIWLEWPIRFFKNNLKD